MAAHGCGFDHEPMSDLGRGISKLQQVQHLTLSRRQLAYGPHAVEQLLLPHQLTDQCGCAGAGEGDGTAHRRTHGVGAALRVSSEYRASAASMKSVKQPRILRILNDQEQRRWMGGVDQCLPV